MRGTEARFRRAAAQGFDPLSPLGRTTRPPERLCSRAEAGHPAAAASILGLSTGSDCGSVRAPGWPVRARFGWPAAPVRAWPSCSGRLGQPSALDRRRLPGLPGLARQARRLLCSGLRAVVVPARGGQVAIGICATCPEWAPVVNLCACREMAKWPAVAAKTAVTAHHARPQCLPGAAPGSIGGGGGQPGGPALERGQLAPQHCNHGGPGCGGGGGARARRCTTAQ